MKSHKITGGGGIQLHLVETGNSRGRPIIFVHGFSQCGLAWSRQMSSGPRNVDSPSLQMTICRLAPGSTSKSNEKIHRDLEHRCKSLGLLLTNGTFPAQDL